MNRLKGFFGRDIKSFNKYMLMIVALFIVSIAGLTSYAIFTSELISDNTISLEVKKVEIPESCATTDIKWTYNFGGNGSPLGGSSTENYDDIKATTDNGFIAVGSVHSDMPAYNISQENGSALITKYNEYGNIVWVKNFGGSVTEAFYGVTETNDGGGYIAVGYAQSDIPAHSITNKGQQDALIVKYDGSGNVVWAKTFGGTSADYFRGIVATSDGYIVVGFSLSDLSAYGLTNQGISDAIIVKYDNSGNIVWTKSFAGTSADYFYAINKTKDGSYIVGGSSSSNFSTYNISNQGGSDTLLVKYDASGNVIWANSIGGSADDIFFGVTQTKDGGYVGVGSTSSNISAYNITNMGNSDIFIVKFSSSGNIAWAKTFGGSENDSGSAVTATSDGGIVTVGGTASNLSAYSLTNNGSYDAIMIKYNASGKMVWSNNFGGTGIDRYNAIISLNDDSLVAVARFDSSVSAHGITAKGGADALIIKYGCAEAATQDTCFNYTTTSTATTITEYKCYAGNPYGLPTITDVVIPTQLGGKPVTIIADTNTSTQLAFYQKGITSVVLPYTLTTIGAYSFFKNNLTALNIPDNVVLVKGDSFRANNIANINWSSRLTTIHGLAFAGNSLTTLVLPDSLESIGSQTFNVNNLSTIKLGTGLTTLGGTSFTKSATSNPNLTSIVNPTGRSFDWGAAVNSLSGYNFVTGTIINARGNVIVTAS